MGEEYTVNPQASYSLFVEDDSENPNCVDQTCFTTLEGMEITIPIQQGMALTLRDTIVQGAYTDGYGGIERGFIAGALSEADANTFVVYGTVTLAQILFGLGVTPDYTFGNGEKGYSFVLSFLAEQVDIQDDRPE